MKKTLKIAIVLLLNLNCSILYAQEFLHEMGKITKSDIDLKYYEKDKDAEAVVIYDIGESKFFTNDEGGLSIQFKRSTRIKIFTEAGFDEALVEIPIYVKGSEHESVDKISAFTYNFEGGKLVTTELEKSEIFEEKLNELWNVKKFTLPNLKPGSIIEFEYTITSPFIFQLQDWEFQRSIPTIYSKYSVYITPFYQYEWIFQGATKFDEYNVGEAKGLPKYFAGIEYKDYISTFVMKDVPAFTDETFITSREDYIMKIDFQLTKVQRPDGSKSEIITTWEKMVDDLLKEERFGKYINSCEKNAKKIIEENNLIDATSQDKTFEKIVDYVKQNFSWNEISGIYAQKKAKEFFTEKTGSVGNINLFLVALLNEAGIEAKPIISSTRRNGKVRQNYPFYHYFNYVLVLAKIDNSLFLTDATEPLLWNKIIPQKCLNSIGLVIQKDKVDWIDLKLTTNSKIHTFIKTDLSKNIEEGDVSIDISATMLDAMELKSEYKNDFQKLEKYLADDQLELTSDVTTQGFDDKNKTYTISYKAKKTTEFIDNKYFIDPFLKQTVSTNPFDKNSRTLPIDLTYKKSRTYISLTTLPEGYSMETLSEPEYNVDNELVTITYSAKQFGNIVNVTASYAFKKSIYDAEDYLKLKLYFYEIVRKFNQKIAIIKN